MKSDLSKGVKGIDISTNKCAMSQPLVSREKTDINHLEGIEKFSQPMQDYYEMADSLSKCFALNLGIKFKIFDVIEELGEKTSVKDILTQLNFKTSERHLLDFLDQLYVHGLLEREGVLENSRYRNSDYTRNYLLKSSLDHYNYVFLNLDRYMRRYSMFEKNFPAGKTQVFSDDVYATEEDMKSYMEYFLKSNAFNFDYLVSKIDFSRYRKVIDIHGLNATLSILIKRKYPTCDVNSFDNKKLKDYVTSKLVGLEMQDAVKLHFGDIRDNLPFETDCVIAPHILMQFSNENKKAILSRIFYKLYNNGDLIIMENLVDENRKKDDCGLKIGFMLAMMGYEGCSLSFTEYKDLLRSVGFADVQLLPRQQGFSDIIIARKVNTGTTMTTSTSYIEKSL
jgi:hypothetical protein